MQRSILTSNCLILNANNQHRTWRVTLQNLKLSNELRIIFRSAAIHDLQKQLQDVPLNLPANYTYSRKAAYQYGWDWGPRLVTAGIWKNVYLQFYDGGRIDQFYAMTQVIKQESIQIEVVLDLFLIEINAFKVQIEIPGFHNVQEDIKNDFPDNFQTYHFSYDVKNLKPWWPRGQGAQQLYEVKVVLLSGNTILDSRTITTGFRKVLWLQEQDQFTGKTFKMNVNGQDVYLKGANYIPPDMFMPRALKNPDVYEKVFNDSVAAGYNGLRLWGGGQFEYDIFYELADRQGIVIWHDLMFACALYPGNQEFLKNVEEELRDNIRRLRIHPSIIMWNGNNEVLIGWREWGWKNNRIQEEIDQLQYWYDQLFLSRIDDVLKEIHPDVYYWPTSPSSTSSNTSELNFGDIHYWQVWASSAPIETYKTYVGRFNSEYGMQAMIDVSNFQKAVSKSFDWSFESPVFQIHERHPVGIPTLNNYLSNYTRSYRNFFELTYNTQVIQHLALTTAISSLRSAKPFNWGTFYWQINDVWPVVSWATVDFYGCWKAGHYAAKQHHKDPAVLAVELDGKLTVTATNDLPQEFSGNLEIIWLGYNGYEYKRWTFPNYVVKPQSSQKVVVENLINMDDLRAKTYLYLRFNCDQVDCSYIGTLSFGSPKAYQLVNPYITYRSEGSKYTFSSKFFAKWVYLYRDDMCVKASDNYFDLIPGVPTTVTVTGPFKFLSFYDIGR